MGEYDRRVRIVADALRWLGFFVVCILSLAACQDQPQKSAGVIEYRQVDFFNPHTPIPLII